MPASDLAALTPLPSEAGIFFTATFDILTSLSYDNEVRIVDLIPFKNGL
jgi:hypothetical protein